jgi:hypothetical protein
MPAGYRISKIPASQQRYVRLRARNSEGKAHLLGIVAEVNDPQPRPCIARVLGADAFGTTNGRTGFPGSRGKAYAYTNLSWITADQVYLARVTPSAWPMQL